MSLTLDSFRNIVEKCGSFGRVEVSDHPETSHGKILRVYGNTRILGRLKVGIINFFSLLGINQVKSDNQLVREKFLHSLKTDLNAAEKDFFSSQFESSIQGTKALKARHIREAITWHDTIQAKSDIFENQWIQAWESEGYSYKSVPETVKNRMKLDFYRQTAEMKPESPDKKAQWISAAADTIRTGREAYLQQTIEPARQILVGHFTRKCREKGLDFESLPDRIRTFSPLDILDSDQLSLISTSSEISVHFVLSDEIRDLAWSKLEGILNDHITSLFRPDPLNRISSRFEALLTEQIQETGFSFSLSSEQKSELASTIAGSLSEALHQKPGSTWGEIDAFTRNIIRNFLQLLLLHTIRAGQADEYFQTIVVSRIQECGIPESYVSDKEKQMIITAVKTEVYHLGNTKFLQKSDFDDLARRITLEALRQPSPDPIQAVTQTDPIIKHLYSTMADAFMSAISTDPRYQGKESFEMKDLDRYFRMNPESAIQALTRIRGFNADMINTLLHIFTLQNNHSLILLFRVISLEPEIHHFSHALTNPEEEKTSALVLRELSRLTDSILTAFQPFADIESDDFRTAVLAVAAYLQGIHPRLEIPEDVYAKSILGIQYAKELADKIPTSYNTILAKAGFMEDILGQTVQYSKDTEWENIVRLDNATRRLVDTLFPVIPETTDPTEKRYLPLDLRYKLSKVQETEQRRKEHLERHQKTEKEPQSTIDAPSFPVIQPEEAIQEKDSPFQKFRERFSLISDLLPTDTNHDGVLEWKWM